MPEELTPRQLKMHTHPLSVFFPPLDQQRVREAAALTGDTVSAFIRKATMRAVRHVEREQGTEALPPLKRVA